MTRKERGTDAPEPTPPKAAQDGILVIATSTATEATACAIAALLPAEALWPVLVVHYSDSRPSPGFAAELKRVSPLPVKEAQDGMPLASGVVVVCPGDREMVLQPDGTIGLLSIKPGPTLRMDRLLNAVSQTYGERGVAVLLASSGSEGAAGALSLKRRNGIVIAQAPTNGGPASGMPRAAVQVGAVDFIRPPDEIGAIVAGLVSGRLDRSTPDEEEVVQQILQMLQARRGTKLDQYRIATLRRRLRKRALGQGYSSLREYLAFLKESQEEMDQLFDSLLINVTEFFRDAEAFRVIEERVIPELAARVREGREVRIWSAGVATGEEAYSIAILLAEALEPGADWSNVKIFATDVDPGALAEARSGFYEAGRLANLSAERMERFFTRNGAGFEVKKSLRRMVVFGQHDLTKDPPIGRLDLIVCRNVMIYFDLPMQQRLLSTFRYSLVDGGVLFLGRSEAISQDSESFESVDRRYRVFRKVGGTTYALPRLGADAAAGGNHENQQIRAAMMDTMRDAELVAALGSLLVENAQMVVCVLGPRMELRLWNRYARNLLGAPQGKGDAFELLPALRDTPLRVAVEGVASSGRRTRLDAVEVQHNGRRHYLDVVIDPVAVNDAQRGALVVGQNVTPREELREALHERSTLLQETIEELQTTNEELQSANEELETTNEELQSANEELMTLNEEMQSTNEELETTNEELQSTNEELATVNARLESSATRIEQLSRVLRCVADLCGNAMIVLDLKENVTLWSARARDYFGQREDEVLGRSIFGTNVATPAEPLRQALREALSAGRKVEVSDVSIPTLEGSPRRLAVHVHVLRDGDESMGWVLSCVDKTPHLVAEDRALSASARYDAILAAARDGIIVVDGEGRVVEMNGAAARLLEKEKPVHLWDLTADRAAVFQLKGALADLTTKHGRSQVQASHEFAVMTKGGRRLALTLHAVAAASAPPIVLVRDLTDGRG